MAVFKQSFSATESLDGLTITYYDTSNWGIGNNDQNYEKADFERTFVGLDPYGDEIFNVTLATTADSFEVSKTTNLWISTTYTATGIALYTLNQEQGFDRLLANKFQQATLQNCCKGCNGKKNKSSLCEALLFIKGADYSNSAGNGVQWQENINAADKFLNTILK